MIGLDTNVIVSWLEHGDRGLLPPSEQYRVSHVALLELEWVLSARLGYPKDKTVAAIKRLIAASDVVLDRPEAINAALEDYSHGGADFGDFLIARDNLAAGCTTTLTLDAKAARKTGFTLVRS
jgi:predicted nucleic-acid-binding protein